MKKDTSEALVFVNFRRQNPRSSELQTCGSKFDFPSPDFAGPLLVIAVWLDEGVHDLN
jgi:hypothetical protein